MHLMNTVKAALIAVAMLCMQPVTAQERAPITLLVGFAAGGTSDLTARLLAQYLPEQLGRPVVVINRPGALGTLSIHEMMSANNADQTFVVLPFSSVVFPALTRSPAPYDIFKDLQPVASVASFPLGVAVNSSTGVRTPREFAAWMRTNSKSAVFGTAGAGGHNHFLGLQLGDSVGVKSTVVPYKGNAPMMGDLLPGHIPAAVMVAGEVLAHTKDDRIRLIGVLTPKRSPLMPDVPTFSEQGVNITSGESWYGMWAGAKADKEQVLRMQEAVRKVVMEKAFQRALTEQLSLVPDFRDAAQTDSRLRDNYSHWAPIIKASGFKAE